MLEVTCFMNVIQSVGVSGRRRGEGLNETFGNTLLGRVIV